MVEIPQHILKELKDQYSEVPLELAKEMAKSELLALGKINSIGGVLMRCVFHLLRNSSNIDATEEKVKAMFPRDQKLAKDYIAAYRESEQERITGGIGY